MASLAKPALRYSQQDIGVHPQEDRFGAKHSNVPSFHPFLNNTMPSGGSVSDREWYLPWDGTGEASRPP
jgi:hypothetical protein